MEKAEKAARQAERAEEREARRVQKEVEKEAKRMEREAKKAEEALKAAKMAQRPRQGGRKVTDVEDDDEDMFGSMFNDERDQEISKYPSICMTMFDDLMPGMWLAIINYDDDTPHQQAGWIGCDTNCGRWFHYWCAGCTKKPRATSKFYCQACKST